MSEVRKLTARVGRPRSALEQRFFRLRILLTETLAQFALETAVMIRAQKFMHFQLRRRP